MGQSGLVANPARGQLRRENVFLAGLRSFALEDLIFRDGFGRPVPPQPVNSAHTPRQDMVPTHGILPGFRDGLHMLYITPSTAIGPIPNLSGHAIIAYRWRTLQHAHVAPIVGVRKRGAY